MNGVRERAKAFHAANVRFVKRTQMNAIRVAGQNRRNESVYRRELNRAAACREWLRFYA